DPQASVRRGREATGGKGPSKNTGGFIVSAVAADAQKEAVDADRPNVAGGVHGKGADGFDLARHRDRGGDAVAKSFEFFPADPDVAIGVSQQRADDVVGQ